MKHTPSVAVVIPQYKSELTQSEQRALAACQRFLGAYDCYVICPQSLKTTLPGFAVKRFDDHYFTSVLGYSQLLLTQDFYTAFTEYEYLLIYQLDAVVFSDQLPHWVSQRVSYIGAPWFSSIIGWASAPQGVLKGGNGGLSLRSVTECLKVLKNVNRLKKRPARARWQEIWSFIWAWLSGRARGRWLETTAEFYPFNEDGFWSFEAEKYSETFHAADFKDSLAFAFETQPKRCFQLNHHQLPFGAHAWERYDKLFWMKIQPELFISISE